MDTGTLDIFTLRILNTDEQTKYIYRKVLDYSLYEIYRRQTFIFLTVKRELVQNVNSPQKEKKCMQYFAFLTIKIKNLQIQ